MTTCAIKICPAPPHLGVLMCKRCWKRTPRDIQADLNDPYSIAVLITRRGTVRKSFRKALEKAQRPISKHKA